MIFNELSDKDKSMIEWYIKEYGDDDLYDDSACQRAPLEKILGEWSKAKEELFHKFGDRFILSQNIHYNESYDEISKRIDEELLLEHQDFVASFMKLFPYVSDLPYYPFGSDRYTEEMREANRAERHSKNPFHYSADKLMSTYVLTRNKYVGWTDEVKEYKLPLKDGTFVKFQEGTKPMRVISKIAKSYGLKGFEEFRNAHSRCLQSKDLSGELCFSIHPLDYMTMSDNNNDWSSCMSWMSRGQYRLGTIEMMNSPCVVVAYLNSSSCCLNIDNEKWNSKKWRCLFIVDSNFICSVKQYPFSNKNLVKIATSKLAETVGWGQCTPFKYEYYKIARDRVELPRSEKGVEFSIRTDTNAMYNDFGTCKNWVIVNPEYSEDGLYIENFNYSGEATCLHCGEPLVWVNEEQDCVTHRMLSRAYCVCCEDRIHMRYDDYYTLADGSIVCPYCFDRDCTTDELTGENIWLEDSIEIHLSRSQEQFDCPLRWYCRSLLTAEDTLEKRLCKNYSRYFKEGVEGFTYDDNTEHWYISIDQLTVEGLHRFGIHDESDLKHFMAANEN